MEPDGDLPDIVVMLDFLQTDIRHPIGLEEFRDVSAGQPYRVLDADFVRPSDTRISIPFVGGSGRHPKQGSRPTSS